MNPITREEFLYEDNFLNFSIKNEIPITNSIGMEFNSFNDLNLYINHEKLFQKNPKRSLRGISFIKQDGFFNLIQISDIGDLFMQTFAFEIDREMDSNIIQFHQKMKPEIDYLNLFESSCFNPELDCYLRKNIRTSKFCDFHYTIHDVSKIKQSMKK